MPTPESCPWHTREQLVGSGCQHNAARCGEQVHMVHSMLGMDHCRSVGSSGQVGKDQGSSPNEPEIEMESRQLVCRSLLNTTSALPSHTDGASLDKVVSI